MEQLCPDVDLSCASQPADNLVRSDRATPHIYVSPPNIQEPNTDSSDEEFPDDQGLVEDENPVFWGKSSDVKLMQYAMDSLNRAKEQNITRRKNDLRKRYEYWDVQPVRCCSSIKMRFANASKVDETSKRDSRSSMQLS